MRRILSTILFIFLLGQSSRFGVPWWAIAPIGVLAGWLFPMHAFRGFLAGFLGGSLLWGITAAMLNNANDGILSAKVGLLFQGLQGWQLVLLTAVLGGLLAGFGVLTGRYARDLYVGSKPND
ncbi:MAG: hypothetical protein H6565_06240 [Lewinellaceae bacterium]|nr:hypothetical protein [Lewinellaceae bacterium]